MPEPFFMRDGGLRLFASLHQAGPEALFPRGLVVCPGLADEHIAGYRIVHRLSERLAAQGVPVLRFDPPGHGDSEGRLADATPERMAQAAGAAAEALRARAGVEHVGFLGVRLGCSAALIAAGEAGSSFCIAWAPILAPDRYFRDLLRRQIVSDVMYGGSRRSVDALLEELAGGESEGVDLGGYLLTGDLLRAHAAVEVTERLVGARFPLLVLQRPGAGAGVPRSLAERVAAGVTAHHASEVDVFWRFPREGSVPEPPIEWMDVTCEWLESSARMTAAEG